MVGTVKVLGPLCKNRHKYRRGVFKSLRYVSTRQCVQCLRDWVKKYSKLPRVKKMLRKVAREHYWKNREKRLVQMREYQKTENFKVSAGRYRTKNKEVLNASTRLWKERNRDRVSKYNRKYIQTTHGKNVARRGANNRRTRRGFITYTPLQL